MIRTYAYKDIKIEEIFAREEEKNDIADAVAEIIAEVRKNGDAALRQYAEKFDGAAPAVFEVSAEERAAAFAAADAAFVEILKEAAAHIRAFHEKQKRTDFVLTARGCCAWAESYPSGQSGALCPRWDGKLSLYGADGLYSCEDSRGQGGLHGNAGKGWEIKPRYHCGGGNRRG